MDYKYFGKTIMRGVIASIMVIYFYSCVETKKQNFFYYVELINFNDSLKKFVVSHINGKATYKKNNKIEIVSLNYITEEYPDMHYFQTIDKIKNTFEPGDKKIKVEFAGSYSIDSIRYSIQRYKYENNQWIKTSDMGFINGYSTYKNLKEYALKEYGNQIINNLVDCTYN